MDRNEMNGLDSPLRCAVCGEVIERIVQIPKFDGTEDMRSVKVRCTCKCERDKRSETEKRLALEEDKRQIEKLKQMSLMDSKLKDVRFSNYEVTKDNARMFKIAKNYVERFDEMYGRGQGILFWGSVGTGKSYTAAAIANELLEKRVSVIMTSFIKLAKEWGASEEMVARLNRARLLVIDDLGAERSTDYALEKVYDIIDSRYRSGKPMILTTNLEMSQMKECEDIRYTRIYDRIFEMCYPVKVSGLSWRKREAALRYADTRTLLEG